jgi:hypothetical protein
MKHPTQTQHTDLSRVKRRIGFTIPFIMRMFVAAMEYHNAVEAR